MVVSNILVAWLFLVWYWIIKWITDIPNLQTVNLPNSFGWIYIKSITSITVNTHEWIDVSPILADLLHALYGCDYIESIESNVTSIDLPDRTCNDLYYNTFNLSRFNLLEELIIGDECFMYINEFEIDGLKSLKSLKIGKNSFTHLKSDNEWNDDIAENRNRSFHILNCVELESIEIGRYSFSDYGGGFELKNLPKLSTIKIGEIGSESGNFYYSSFVIKGMIDVYIANE